MVYSSVSQTVVRGPPMVLVIYRCGPSKKYRWKIKIQINCISHYRWKSQSLEIIHGNRISLSLPLYWHFMKFITLPIYRLPTLLLATKEGFKALWTWCFSPYFPCTSDAAPVTQPGTTRFYNCVPNTEPFHVGLFVKFLIVFPTPSLYSDMVTYCTLYTNNRTSQIAYIYAGIKVWYKLTN